LDIGISGELFGSKQIEKLQPKPAIKCDDRKVKKVRKHADFSAVRTMQTA